MANEELFEYETFTLDMNGKEVDSRDVFTHIIQAG